MAVVVVVNVGVSEQRETTGGLGTDYGLIIYIVLELVSSDGHIP